MHPATVMHTFPLQLMANDAERIDDRRAGHGRRESDHPNPWGDPRLWLGVLMFLWTVSAAVLGIIWSKLDTISTSVAGTRDLVLVSSTKNEGEIKALNERLAKAENALETITKAYNYNLNHRLTYIEARTGIKAPPANKQED